MTNYFDMLRSIDEMVGAHEVNCQESLDAYVQYELWDEMTTNILI